MKWRHGHFECSEADVGVNIHEMTSWVFWIFKSWRHGHFEYLWGDVIGILGKSILQVPDTGTRVLDNTRPFLRSSIESFWITPACSKERKYHIFRQYWYTRNVPVFINTGKFQYLGPQDFEYEVTPWVFWIFIVTIFKITSFFEYS